MLLFFKFYSVSPLYLMCGNTYNCQTSGLGTCSRYSRVVDEDVKKPTKHTNEQTLVHKLWNLETQPIFCLIDDKRRRWRNSIPSCKQYSPKIHHSIVDSQPRPRRDVLFLWSLRILEKKREIQSYH